MLTLESLKSLSDALRINKTLALVELFDRHPGEVRERFNKRHNNQAVDMITLPLPHKLAFTNAHANKETRASGAIMDRWIFEQIFEFAGTPAQRKIL